MGLFGDLDVASAADNPWDVDDGTYEVTVTSAKVGPTKDGKKKGLTLEYTITTEGKMKGRKVQEWKEIPQPADPQNLTPEEDKQASFLKMRLSTLGIPEKQMNTIDTDDLVAIDAVITVQNKDGYTNVKKLVLAADAPASSSSGENPFA